MRSAIEHDRQRRVAVGEVGGIRGHFGTPSPREHQVMILITAGKKNKQVAGDLGLSEITVNVHRGNAMRKVSVHTFTAAFAWRMRLDSA